MRDNVGWLINRYHGNILWGFWENQEKEVILWIVIKIAEKNKWEMLALVRTADPKEFGGRSAGESTSSDKSSWCQGIGRSIGESVIRVLDRMKVIGL